MIKFLQVSYWKDVSYLTRKQLDENYRGGYHVIIDNGRAYEKVTIEVRE